MLKPFVEVLEAVSPHKKKNYPAKTSHLLDLEHKFWEMLIFRLVVFPFWIITIFGE